MRLICPNCEAQYEVSDDMVPATGRDVQCSSCSHTWFEPPRSAAAEEAVEPDTDTEDDISNSPAPDPAPQPDLDEDAFEADLAPEPAKPIDPDMPPSGLTPDVADVLREEAAFEQAARKADAQSVSAQAEDEDFDLTESIRRVQAAQDRLVELSGQPEGGDADASAAAAPAAAAAATPAGRTRRPPSPRPTSEVPGFTRRPPAPSELDRATSDEGSAPSAPTRPAFESAIDKEIVLGSDEPTVVPETSSSSGSGFKTGFTLTVFLAVIATLVYAFSPEISQALPQAEAYLVPYVEAVDAGRIWLDGTVQDLIAKSGLGADAS